MLAPLFGYFFCMITVLAAAVVLLTGVSNISTLGNGRHYPRAAIENGLSSCWIKPDKVEISLYRNSAGHCRDKAQLGDNLLKTKPGKHRK